jgi:hypothetical protein
LDDDNEPKVFPASPRTGGTTKPDVHYELWPGVAAPGYVLQAA